MFHLRERSCQEVGCCYIMEALLPIVVKVAAIKSRLEEFDHSGLTTTRGTQQDDSMTDHQCVVKLVTFLNLTRRKLQTFFVYYSFNVPLHIVRLQHKNHLKTIASQHYKYKSFSEILFKANFFSMR